MALTTQDIEKIAKLAHIAVTDEEKAHYASELSKILQFVEQLQEVNTDGVEQMTSVASMQLYRRPDAVTDGNYRDAVVANAPHSEYGCFTVPKVIE